MRIPLATIEQMAAFAELAQRHLASRTQVLAVNFVPAASREEIAAALGDVGADSFDGDAPSQADFASIEQLAGQEPLVTRRPFQFSLLFLLLILIGASIPFAVLNLHLHFVEAGGDQPHSGWTPWKTDGFDDCPSCGIG